MERSRRYIRLYTKDSICLVCKERPVRPGLKSVADGAQLYRGKCSTCHNKKFPMRKETRYAGIIRRHPYLKHKKMICEVCGFKAENICQMDIHHINGDHSDNHISNLQTLCSNCHRIETHRKRERKRESASIREAHM